MKQRLPVLLGLCLLGLCLLGSVQAQSVNELFAGMTPLEGVAYEVLADPSDVMSPRLPASIDELEPEGAGYRFFYAETLPPDSLYTDVCPAGFETVWYTVEASDFGPVNFDFQGEVHPSEGGTEGDFFFSYFPGDEARVATPLYVGSCQYSDRRKMVYRSHNLNIRPAVWDLSRVIRLSCNVSVVNTGKRTVLAQQTLDNITFCYGEQNLD